MTNLFVGYGKSVSDERLVGRAEIIKKMKRNLLAGSNVSISGLRRIGKTSLARQVCKEIYSSAEGIRCIEIAMNTVTSEQEFYRQLSKKLWPKDNFAICNFADDAHSFYLHITDHLEHDYIDNNYKSTIIMLDELDHIRNISNSNIIVNRIREIANNPQCGVTFFFVSARSLRCLEDNTGNVSNLHGICSCSYLRPLSKDIGLKQMLQRINIENEEILDVLFQKSGGHPFLAEILLYFAIDLANEEQAELSVDLLEQAIELEDCASAFVLYYDKLEEFISSWDQDVEKGKKVNAFDELLDVAVGPKLKETDVRLNNFFTDYGLITKDGLCMSEHFRDYLSYKRRQKPFEPLLDDLERTLRDLIKKVFVDKKGNNWMEELKQSDEWFKDVFDELAIMMRKEQRLWNLGGAADILEYSYPGTLKDIICRKWKWFQEAVGNSQPKFCDWMDAIAKIRNPVKHNRLSTLIPPEEYEKAKRACQELLRILKGYQY